MTAVDKYIKTGRVDCNHCGRNLLISEDNKEVCTSADECFALEITMDELKEWAKDQEKKYNDPLQYN